jgi:hypothetical protein
MPALVVPFPTLPLAIPTEEFTKVLESKRPARITSVSTHSVARLDLVGVQIRIGFNNDDLVVVMAYNKYDIDLIFIAISTYIVDLYHDILPNPFSIEYRVEFGMLCYTIYDVIERRNSLVIPDEAPSVWPGRREAKKRGLSVVQFFEDVWAKYIPCGLTMTDIYRRDRGLYQEIYDYGKKRKGEEPWPERLKLPSERTGVAAARKLADSKGWEALSLKQKLALTRAELRAESRGVKKLGNTQKKTKYAAPSPS